MDGDGSVVTICEQDELSDLMTPYVHTMTEYLGHLRRRAGRRFRTPTWAILFCTYLKAGYLHILAFPPAQPSVTAVLVDSIPISARNSSEEECRSRLRLATALFTLQRYVIRFAEHWDENVWPRTVFDQEYTKLVELLGYSESSSSTDNGDWWHHPANPSEYRFENWMYMEADTSGRSEHNATGDSGDDCSEDDKSEDDGSDDGSDDGCDDEDNADENDDDDGDDEDEDGENDNESDNGDDIDDNDEASERDSQRDCEESSCSSESDEDSEDGSQPSAPLGRDRWNWLERVYTHYKLTFLIFNMRRVEEWVETYDPCQLKETGRPIR